MVWFWAMSVTVPSRETFRELAEAGNLIPVYREILADHDTPVSAYARLGRPDYSFLLESVVGGEKWAAYSFIGVEPRAVVRWKHPQKGPAQIQVTWHDVDGQGAERRAEWPVSDVAGALAEIMADFHPVAVPGLPRFWGGAVGWIGYDAVRSFEELPARAPTIWGCPTSAWS
jgi:anthranilate synthase component 1